MKARGPIRALRDLRDPLPHGGSTRASLSRLAWGLLLLGLSLTGCEQNRMENRGAELESASESAQATDPPSSTALPKQGSAQALPAGDESGFVRPEGSAFVEAVRKAHQLADVAQTVEAKTDALNSLTSAYKWNHPQSSPHIVAVRQDLAARAANIALELRRHEQARNLAQRGLRLSDKPTVLRANLLMVLADAEEALGNQDATREALLEAIQVNQNLMTTELESP